MAYDDDLKDLQKKEGSHKEIMIIGFIMAVIVALVLMAKTAYFNSMRKSTDSSLDYQKIAMYSLGIWIFITFCVKYIF